MRIDRLILLVVIISFISIPHNSEADWINFTGAELSSTIAEVYVEEDKIIVVLEIGDRDKEAFADLISDPGESADKDALARRKRFFKEGFVILADGKPLN
jgi:hypothetical protein